MKDSLSKLLRRFVAGLPETPMDRVSLALAALASVWFALCATWEIGAPFAAGHYAASTAIGTAGENMWRFGIIAPFTSETLLPPNPQQYYCHHPFGTFWTAAALVKVFGHHFWVCRLPAVAMSALTPPLLFLIGRSLWSSVAGAGAALAFAVLPIALAYANFHALEVPVMFGVALAIWGYLRFVETSRRRFMAACVFGLVFAVHADWPAFVFAGFFLVGVLFRAVFRRHFAPVDLTRLMGLWAFVAVACAASGAFYLLAFQKYGTLQEFFRQGEFRSAGAEAKLSEVLESRRTWILTAFTPLAIELGKAALPVVIVRCCFKKSEEWLVLAVLGMATFQYVAFKQGADIHFFWPHHFALYFALAAGSLTQTLCDALEAGVRALRREPKSGRAAAIAPWLALISAASVCVLIVPDGFRSLVYARKTGGRFNEKGSIIQPDIDKAYALGFLKPKLESQTGVIAHPSMKASYWFDWALEHPVLGGRVPHGPAEGLDQYFVLDTRFAAPEDTAALVEGFPTTLVGPFLFADRSASVGQAPRVESFAIDQDTGGFFERYFGLGSHAARSMRKDAWLAWELLDHFAKGSAVPAPGAVPVDHEDLRIAHNAAVARGDQVLARSLLGKLLQGTSQKPACSYVDGTLLLGVRFEPGLSDVLTVYFLAGDGPSKSQGYAIHSVVELAPAWSLTPPDPVVRDVGMPSLVPPARWKAGYVYSTITEVLKRPGRERYVGGFRGRGSPAPVDCGQERTLLTLE